MKRLRTATMLIAGVTAAACSILPPPALRDEPAQWVSSDYLATGDASNVTAYIYGGRTLLELGGTSTLIAVHDAQGVAVQFERIGQYYRMARRLSSFTAWTSNGVLAFSAAPLQAPSGGNDISAAAPAPVPALLSAPAPAIAPPQSTASRSHRAEDAAMAAALNLAQAQLADLRIALDAIATNPKATGEDLFAAHARLDEISERLSAMTAIVRISFASGETRFRPAPEIGKALISAAKAADSILIRGRTDAKVAGPADSRIAADRANAARRYLVEHGVSGAKIKVAALASGDFLLPNVTPEARTVNRRVEIELSRHAPAKLIRDDVQTRK